MVIVTVWLGFRVKARARITVGMYRIGIFTVWPEPDSGWIVESAVRLELEFTAYRILM